MANLLWPYPSEDAKRVDETRGPQPDADQQLVHQPAEGTGTGCSTDEAQPISETEARHMILEKHGNVEAS